MRLLSISEDIPQNSLSKQEVGDSFQNFRIRYIRIVEPWCINNGHFPSTFAISEIETVDIYSQGIEPGAGPDVLIP